MRYLITGGSGYLGSRLIERLSAREDTERIVLTDIRAPRALPPKTEYREVDIRSPEMHALVEAEKPDALVHLAFVLNPIRDEALMYDIDVNGTQNALNAAERAEVGHVLVASSATAYGAWPDNPVPITEEQPVRGVPGFAYSRDKAEIDRMTQLWAARHPDRTVTIVRPSIITGPNIDNFIIRGWESYPIFPQFDGDDPPMQFMHEDDLAEAVIGLLESKKDGEYNLGADGTVKASECAAMVRTRTRTVNFDRYSKVHHVLWKLHAPKVEAPAGMLAFIRYPWVVSNEKVKRDLGWQPTHDSREAFRAALRARGIAV